MPYRNATGCQHCGAANPPPSIGRQNGTQLCMTCGEPTGQPDGVHYCKCCGRDPQGD